MSTVCGREASSTGRATDASQQRARHSDDGHGTGRRDDVKADVELNQNLAVIKLSLCVVMTQLFSDEVTEADNHHTCTRYNTRP